MAAPKRRQCAAMQEYERLLEEQPSFRGNQQRAEDFTARAVTSGEADRVARKLVTIPTVVHVVWNKPKENISDAQIRSQMAALNLDFRATNPDVSQVPAPWQGLVADAKIKFQLATKDPDGKRTNGIVRVQTDRTSFGPGDGVKRAGKGGSAAWPSDAYLNLWVGTLGGGLLGYAQFPGGPNLMEPLIDCARAHASEGEIVESLQQVFGTYRETPVF